MREALDILFAALKIKQSFQLLLGTTVFSKKINCLE
jgi:hypothetical protein